MSPALRIGVRQTVYLPVLGCELAVYFLVSCNMLIDGLQAFHHVQCSLLITHHALHQTTCRCCVACACLVTESAPLRVITWLYQGAPALLNRWDTCMTVWIALVPNLFYCRVNKCCSRIMTDWMHHLSHLNLRGARSWTQTPRTRQPQTRLPQQHHWVMVLV